MLLGFLTIVEVTVSLLELRANLLKVRAMILFETAVHVLRFGKVVEVSSGSLVPGDVMLISSLERLPCDCRLLEGQCVMNEAILTGESIPVNK